MNKDKLMHSDIAGGGGNNSLLLKSKYFLQISSKTKKSFLPTYSVLLALLLLAPSASLKADSSFGTTGCSTTSTTSCISGTSTDGTTVSVTDLGDTSDEKSISISGLVLNNPARKMTMTVNKTILRKTTGPTAMTIGNGSIVTFNFKNSVYWGNFTNSGGGFNGYTSNLTFDGGYQGNSDNNLKGYAFVGNITLQQQNTNLNFKNDANMKGNVITTGNSSGGTGVGSFNFTNSSLEGKIDSSSSPWTPKMTLKLNFSGNSPTKGYAYKGDVSQTEGNIEMNFSNNAKMIGNIAIKQNSYNRSGTFKANFTNSSLTGNINSVLSGYSGLPTSTFSFSGNQSEDGYALSGNITNSIKTMNLSFDNGAIWKNGNFNLVDNWKWASTLPIVSSNVSNITLKNNSVMNGNINAIGGYNTVNLTMSGNAVIKGTITGNAKVVANITDSSLIQGISNSNGASTLTFGTADAANAATKALAGTADASKKITIGNLTSFSGLISGTIYNAASIGNVTLQKNGSNLTIDGADTLGDLVVNNGTTLTINTKGTQGKNITTTGTVNVTANSSTFGAITNNNTGTTTLTLSDSSTVTGAISSLGAPGSSITITADHSTLQGKLNTYNGGVINLTAKNNSTLGTEGNTGNILDAAWGNINATLSGTTVYGNVSWQDANYGTSGLAFSDNSKLIGDIGGANTIYGNVGQLIKVSFNNSSMQGNMNVKAKNKNNQYNSLTVSFSGKSAFTGSISADNGTTLNATFDGTTLNIGGIDAAGVADGSSLSFKNISGAQIGNINFSGAFDGDFKANSKLGNIVATGTLTLKGDESSFGDITLSQNSTLTLSNNSSLKNLNINNGTTTATLSNHSSIDGFNLTGAATVGTLNLSDHSVLNNVVSNTESTLNLNLKNSSILGHQLINGGGRSNITMSSDASKISFDASKRQALLASLMPKQTAPAPEEKKEDEINKDSEAPKDASEDKAPDEGSAPKAPDTEVKDTPKVGSAILNPSSTQNRVLLSASDGDASISKTPDDKDPTASTGSSTAPADGDAKTPALTPAMIQTLAANPTVIQNYLLESGVSSYAGDITTSGGVNNIDFNDSLYLGGNVNTTAGTANITLSFSDAFIKQLQTDPLVKTILYAGKGPVFNVTTDGANAINNIALSGSIKGVANIAYIQGATNIVFADKMTPATPADAASTATSGTSSTTSAFVGGDTTDFANSGAYDPDALEGNRNTVKVNGYSYSDGILVRLDAAKADALLAPYRKLFPTNQTTFEVDKISNPKVYSAKIYGAMIGRVDSLPTSASTDAESDVSYQAIFEKNSVFIGTLNITDRNVSVDLSQGAKLILEDDSTIGTLSNNVAETKPFTLDMSNITGDSILQSNTIVDLATGGIPAINGNLKSSFNSLEIQQVKDLSNAVFRLSYNPYALPTDEQSNKSDHLIVESVTNTASSDASTTIPLHNYLQVFQNVSKPVMGDLLDRNIVVVSIKNNADGQPGLAFGTSSTVQQGYDLITTSFVTKKENSPDGSAVEAAKENAEKSEALKAPAEDKSGEGVIGGAVHTASAASTTTSTAVLSGVTEAPAPGSVAPTDTSKDKSADASTTGSYTNYYVASASSKIVQSTQDLTVSALATNYSIFLSNINDLNKRLGELRDNPSTQGVWARVFNGMTTSSRGEEVKTYSTNVQGGYDYGFSFADAASYLGVALSYGYNTLKADTFSGKANLFELGVYYSYVGNSGWYSDTIGKYALITNTLSLPNNDNQDTTLNSSTLSLGEEFGYRWIFTLKDKETSKHSLYLEPSAEFIGGYIGNGSFDEINGNAFLNAAIADIFALRARVGGVIGYSYKTGKNQTDFRAGVSYVGDMLFGGKMDLTTNFSAANSSLANNQMALVSLGINSILSQHWRVYADFDTSFGGKYYNQNYLVSVGGRYAFGNAATNTRIQRQNNSAAIKQQASIKPGFYFEVFVMGKNEQLSSKQKEFLSKYPYTITLENQEVTLPNKQGKQVVVVQKILIGPFQTKQGALKSQNTANEIAHILNNKEVTAVLREVK